MSSPDTLLAPDHCRVGTPDSTEQKNQYLRNCKLRSIWRNAKNGGHILAQKVDNSLATNEKATEAKMPQRLINSAFLACSLARLMQ